MNMMINLLLFNRFFLYVFCSIRHEREPSFRVRQIYVVYAIKIAINYLEDNMYTLRVIYPQGVEGIH